MLKKSLLLTKILIISLFLTISCNKTPKVNTFVFKGIGTILSVSYYGKENKNIEKEVKSYMKQFEKDVSYYNKDGFVGKINLFAGKKAVKVPNWLCKLVKKSASYSEKTDGAFDITYKSEGFLWEKGGDNLPPEEKIKNKLKLVGVKNIETDCKKNVVFLKYKGVKIDLGGVAKGYSIDKTAEILKKAGITNFIVNYGGDMLVCGKKGNKDWIVGIKNPLKEGFLKKIKVKKECEGIATSGDYERFVIKKHKKYSHIINPKTGMPVEEAHSVTVIAKNAIDADAFATAISVKHKDLKFIKKIVDKNKLKVYTLFGDERNVEWREF